ncbi:type II toxin-antitoxin system VapC family toxin [Subtercola lobariae]|uniref:Ribonuclease VapC46 n=1 Tax=Subtercola lobariae TaxID=1588641 RepID=A0A917B941_9MICO|nr:type II toxin-antitoxin system VapC family toxin [Subtercola lobariae]GGF30059.1 ribonuclease VapC46 [Subtercola lobariae]
MICYLDTSAAGKLLVTEPESDALVRHLDQFGHRRGSVIASSTLLETELRRMASRLGFTQAAVSGLLRKLSVIDIERDVFREAGLMLPGGSLRSLDAPHIATAERIAADEFISYDERQAQSAAEVGLRVTQPA